MFDGPERLRRNTSTIGWASMARTTDVSSHVSQTGSTSSAALHLLYRQSTNVTIVKCVRVVKLVCEDDAVFTLVGSNSFNSPVTKCACRRAGSGHNKVCQSACQSTHMNK